MKKIIIFLLIMLLGGCTYQVESDKDKIVYVKKQKQEEVHDSSIERPLTKERIGNFESINLNKDKYFINVKLDSYKKTLYETLKNELNDDTKLINPKEGHDFIRFTYELKSSNKESSTKVSVLGLNGKKIIYNNLEEDIEVKEIKREIKDNIYKVDAYFQIPSNENKFLLVFGDLNKKAYYVIEKENL